MHANGGAANRYAPWSDFSSHEFTTLHRVNYAPQNERLANQSRFGASNIPNGNGLPHSTATIDAEKRHLNALFDDIEHFANRLTQAVAAANQLERREKHGIANQRMGQPTQNARLFELARMPSDSEICEVLREFRTAFNSLAELRPYISATPSISEIMRFLIALLRTILDRTRSTYTGESPASSIIRPSFNPETMEMFRYTLTLEEQQFLKSLGPSWWTSEPERTPELTPPQEAFALDFARSPQAPHSFKRQESSGSATDTFAVRNARFLEDLRARGASAYEVVIEYEPKRAEELQVQRGEVLEVLGNQRQWWKVRNALNQIGFCPCTVLRDIPGDLPPRDYGAGDDHPTNGASNGYSNGLLGHVPPRPPSPSGLPEPPPLLGFASPRRAPPVVKPKPGSAAAAANASANVPYSAQNGNRPTSNAFAQELENRLATKSKQPVLKRPSLNARVKLTQDSTPEEVVEWLSAKGYDPKTIEVLTGVNGLQLFTMEKNDPQRLLNCEPSDLRKLKDHILLEKNRSNYETMGKKQLKAVLERQKQKVEQQNAPDDV